MDYSKALLALKLRERMIAIFNAENSKLDNDAYQQAFSNAKWKDYFAKAYSELELVTSMLDEITKPSDK